MIIDIELSEGEVKKLAVGRILMLSTFQRGYFLSENHERGGKYRILVDLPGFIEENEPLVDHGFCIFGNQVIFAL
mgnify:CR=1 FL=1